MILGFGEIIHASTVKLWTLPLLWLVVRVFFSLGTTIVVGSTGHRARVKMNWNWSWGKQSGASSLEPKGWFGNQRIG